MKRLLIFLVIIVIVGGLYGIYSYNKNPVDTRDESADFEISAPGIVKEFSANEDASTKKYVDKILIVTGEIKEIDISTSTLFLDGSDPLITITCSFYANESNRLKKLKSGDIVKVKGKCTGKLIDIVMNNCILVNSK